MDPEDVQQPGNGQTQSGQAPNGQTPDGSGRPHVMNNHIYVQHVQHPPQPAPNIHINNQTTAVANGGRAQSYGQGTGGSAGGGQPPSDGSRSAAPVPQGGGSNPVWGRVVRGALIVGAAVLVGVVAYALLAPAVTGLLTSGGTMGVAANATVGAIQTVFQGLVGVGQIALNSAAIVWAHVSTALGLGSIALPTAHVASAATTVGLVGGGIAGLATLKALPSMHLIDPVATGAAAPTPDMAAAPAPHHDPAMGVGTGAAQVHGGTAVAATNTQVNMGSQSAQFDSSGVDDSVIAANAAAKKAALIQQAQQSHAVEEASHHAGHHAAEHSNERHDLRSATQRSQSWADLNPSRKGAAVSAAYTAREVAPRDASYAAEAQKQADIAALADSSRA